MGVLISNVVSRLTSTMADLTGRFSDNDVKQALDMAAVNIVNFKHDANVVVEEFSVQPNTPIQQLPEGAFSLIDCVSNVGRTISADLSVRSIPITQQDRELIESHVPDWSDPVATNEIQHYFYDRDIPTQFEVFPVPITAIPIKINYSKAPKSIDVHNGRTVEVLLDGSAVIPLSEVYETAIYYFALYQLYSVDNVDPMMAQTATNYLNEFFRVLGIQQKAEYKIIQAK